MGYVEFLGLGSFALWFETTVKLLSSAHQGGRHIAEAQRASRPTAWLKGPTSSKRSGRASPEAAKENRASSPRYHGYHNSAFQRSSPFIQ